jgi:catechol 2,3-dioxygenase-like lactoylglutathione lyase family enzyme
LILGRFLEISVHAPAIQDSLAFYESLGFVQASVGETWPHPYAVVTDGRLFLGLHGALPASPSITFVAPQLLHVVDQLEAHGIEFDELHLEAEAFNRAAFRDPTGVTVNLLEARTFSPPQLDRAVDTTCGYFSELGVPVRESEPLRAFWEPLGFVALEEELRPFARTPLTSDRLNLALYRSRAFRSPVLAFEDEHMQERLARLRERGFTLTDEMPDGLDESLNAVLIAPEGTRLLLMQAAET